MFAIQRDRLTRAIVAHTGKPVGNDIRFAPVFRMDEAPGAMIRALAATFRVVEGGRPGSDAAGSSLDPAPPAPSSLPPWFSGEVVPLQEISL